jgi:hypothetical protein
MNPHPRFLTRAAQNKGEGFGRVNRRFGVRAHDDRRHPARRSSLTGGAKTLLVPLPRFADFYADIDDARRQTFVVAIYNALGFSGAQLMAGLSDNTVNNAQIAVPLGPVFGIDQSRILKQ